MFGRVMGSVVIAAAALCAAAPANAASFVFTSGSNTALFGGVNSVALPSVAGITVTATAWATATSAVADLPVAGYVGRYTNGLGVTNGGEGNGSTNNAHTIDNVVQYDFIKLEFSQAVKLTGLTLVGFDVDGNSSTPIDTDAWISYGTGTNAFNTTALWQGYLDRGATMNNGAAFPTISSFSKVWLVGAARTTTDRNDGFKLSTITAVAQVPEPATWLTVIVGFGMMGGALRRRTKPASLPTA